MSKSLFRLYDDHYMEVVRIMSLEEIMCVVHDVIKCVEADRIRDIGPAQMLHRDAGLTPPCETCGEDRGIRPGWKSLEAVKHAMDSANLDTTGFQTSEDRREVFGDDVAYGFEAAQAVMDGHMQAIADIMEETGVSLPAATVIYQMQQAEKHEDISNLDIPDDLGGFGWSA